MPVSFTFDVEPHDRIEAAAGYDCPADTRAEYARRMETSTRWLLDTLAQHQARATFFVVGEVAATHSQLVRDMANAGHEVACHSWDHRRVHRFNPFTFRADVRRAKETLEQASGQAVVGYRRRHSASFARPRGRSTCWLKKGSGTTRPSSRCDMIATACRTPRGSRSGFTAKSTACSNCPQRPLASAGSTCRPRGAGTFACSPPR